MSTPGQEFVSRQVIKKLFATHVHAACLVGKLFAGHHFVLELDVGQLVF